MERVHRRRSGCREVVVRKKGCLGQPTGHSQHIPGVLVHVGLLPGSPCKTAAFARYVQPSPLVWAIHSFSANTSLGGRTPVAKRRIGVPEFRESELRDRGCSYHSSCLRCPYSRCRYEPGGKTVRTEFIDRCVEVGTRYGMKPEDIAKSISTPVGYVTASIRRNFPALLELGDRHS